MDIEKMINEVRKLYKLQQIIPEWTWFLEQIEKTKPKVIIEIGMASGASSLCLSYFTEHLISIDSSVPRNQDVFHNIKQNCKFDFVSGNSNEKKTISKVINFLNGKEVDVLFIDGDHSYDGAKEDFNRYKKLVKPGGIIGIHDIAISKYHIKNGCYVFQLWNKIKKQYPSCCSEKAIKYWGGIGLVKLPITNNI
ncbi:hypothetical protein LCGC14_1505190 [marine sediment metagenome]|uniref:Methyltransferase domain-containing protein n=1 Tax=marine sediment metagenome TaxID=412755 RepID=A0A0F9M495_9ZZZZ